jgi:hypothetical protein
MITRQIELQDFCHRLLGIARDTLALIPGRAHTSGTPTALRWTLYAEDMSKMIQVRDVRDQVHRTLKARAAREGMSLSNFIKKELDRTAERPTMREWLESARQAKPISSKRSAAQIVRELRDAQ